MIYHSTLHGRSRMIRSRYIMLWSANITIMIKERNVQLLAGWGFNALSLPGKALASFLNNALTLNPAFALLSMNIMPSFVARSSPSSTDTCLLSDRSVLFPTSTMITSFPRSLRTSSIHLEVLRNEARSEWIRRYWEFFSRYMESEET